MPAFWTDIDAEARQREMVHFDKDLALAGTALVLFAVIASTDLGRALTGPACSLR
ncbi:hypothetical protein AB0H58_13680 [Nocardia neocaledoniensis]|uniref:hypothetical protein n=1 Tax=Nocardia neocaledoniensis TaxID=236511 RepID=UPI0033CA8DC4